MVSLTSRRQHQPSFAHAEFAGKKKLTRREKFLGEMDRVVPWALLVALLEPYYPQGRRGRPPIGLERMLRIYFLQHWYALADEALEDALYDSQALRFFAGIELSVESVPAPPPCSSFAACWSGSSSPSGSSTK